MARSSPTLFFACLSIATGVLALPQGLAAARRGLLPHIDTDLVARNAIAVTNQSWEYGALMESVIELDAPSLSVFASKPFPPPTRKNPIPDAVWAVVTNVLDKEQPEDVVFIDGAGAAGDPASIGVGAILCNTVAKNETWTDDIEKQLDHLLYDVPHSAEGAISQRESEVQYWADYMYMVPPFLAYYGAYVGGENGTALLKNAHLQSKLYREALFDDSVSLWRHIEGGSWHIDSRWATGNAWAAMGMMRVLATIRASHAAHHLRSEQQDLVNWVNEILKGAYAFQTVNGTLYNDIDLPEDQTFADAAGTALLTAAAYRLAAITKDLTYLPNAELAYSLVLKSVNSEGWLTNAVNPLTFDTPLTGTIRSPEGQSFVLSLVASRKAYYDSLW